MCRPLRKGVNRTDAAPLPGYRPAMDTTATELARLVRDRALSAVEIVEAHLRRIEAVNPAINAVVALDADRALAAAREMLDRLQGFNAWLREEGLHDGFKMGIGLNSGPVMSGHVGSERRLEYTALGDTTNTAARLEGMTKGTPHQLYVADSTRSRLASPPDDLVFYEEMEVRGRTAKVRLWGLDGVGRAEAVAPPASQPEVA